MRTLLFLVLLAGLGNAFYLDLPPNATVGDSFTLTAFDANGSAAANASITSLSPLSKLANFTADGNGSATISLEEEGRWLFYVGNESGNTHRLVVYPEGYFEEEREPIDYRLVLLFVVGMAAVAAGIFLWKPGKEEELESYWGEPW